MVWTAQRASCSRASHQGRPPRRARSLLTGPPIEAAPPPTSSYRTGVDPLELLVREVIAARLRRSPESLPLQGDLAALGLDSLKAVELAGKTVEIGRVVRTILRIHLGQ